MRQSRVEDVLPLSPLQEGLLFHALYDEQTPDVYTVQFAFDLKGATDTSVLRDAVAVLLRRHANLRASFRQRKTGETVQVIARDVELPWTEHDLSTVDGARQADELARLLAEDRATRFDLTAAPLLRFTLIRLGADRHRLVVANHHILLDGWSMPLLVRELFTLYAQRGAETGLPRVTPYRDYLGWLAGQDRAAAEESWRESLAGVTEPTLLARADPGRAPIAPEKLTVELSEELTRRVQREARRHGLTLNTVVQGAWGLVLGRLTGRTDVLFGATVSGRPPQLAGVESMVGLFINTLPVRVRTDPAEPLIELLGRLQAEQAALLGHQHLRLSDVQNLLGLGEMFDTLTVFENYPLDPDALRLPGTGLTVEGITGRDATHYPLTLVAMPGSRLQLRLDYRPDLFDHATAERILARLRRVLDAVIAQPELPVGRIDVLAPDEREQILVRWNDSARDIPPGTLTSLFEDQAAKTPAGAALIAPGVELTYGELNERANRLAHLLIERGVGPERLVALALPRSVDLVVAVLAVTKAGGAYLPIDPSYPADRVAFMLADAAPALVLATSDVPHPDCALLLDELVLDGHPATDPTDTGLRAQHPAYVIYTSGSTGTPKGVVVSHAGLASFAAAEVDRFDVRPGDRVLQFSSPSFDACVLELCMAFRAGAALVIPPPGPLVGRELAELLARQGVTHALIPPAALASVPPTALPEFRTLVVGGDACSGELVAAWSPGRRMINAYGPTESTVAATFSEPLSGTKIPPIGRPVWNTHVYVLDGNLQPVPAGVAGELYVSGAGLARGYLRRPGLTAARFVADPFAGHGKRMYRTGDVVRWTEPASESCAELEYLGRADDQVKVRGFRIELGEIESALVAHPEVARATVVVREDQPGVKQLVAYVVPVDGAMVVPGELRDTVAARLPEHMVPAAFVSLTEFPLTANGSKLDRQALPKPEFTPRAATTVAPRTPVERTLLGLFAEVLGVPTVGVLDSFFDLGGDSIVSIQLVSRARKAGLVITPRQVFEHRTVAGLAAVAVGATEAVAAPADDGVGVVALTPIVHWLRERGGPIDGFHQSMLLTVPADLGEERLVAAVQALLDHHDTLRLRLTRAGGIVWGLEVAPRGAVSAASCVTRVDAAGADLRELAAAQAKQAQALLSPERGAMLRVVWLDAGPDRPGRLLVLAHHLVVDGVSWRILLPDLAAAWRVVAAGETPVLAPVGTSYRRWAEHLVALAQHPARLAEIAGWTQQAAGPDPLLGDRPLDAAVDTVETVRQLTLSLPAERTEPLLTRVPAAVHGRVNDVLLTALALAVADWRRGRGVAESSVLLDLEGHGREDVVDGVDLSRTVGWFTSLYPVRLDAEVTDWADVLAGGESVGAALKRVKEQLRAVPDNGIGYGLLRHLNPQTGPMLAGLPAPQLGFNYLGRFAAPGADSGAEWSAAPEAGALGGGVDPGTPAPHGLEITALTEDHADGPRLTVTWSWPGGLLPESDVRDLAEAWFRALDTLAAHAARPGAGGRTPSDLPLVSLRQQEIEIVETAGGELTDVLPLSSLQHGLLFHALYDRDASDVYTVQLLLDLEGPLDVDVLRASARVLLDRHPNLRAGFWQDGLRGPVQFVPREVSLPWHDIDLSTVDNETVELERLLALDRATRFDLAAPPLLRFTAIRLAGGRHRLVFTNHHILLDGWSAPLLVRELFEIYAAGGVDTALPTAHPYRDYLAWFVRQDRAPAEGAWRAALAGVEEPTLLAPADPSRVPALPERLSVDLSTELTAALTDRAKRLGLTLNTVFQGVWGVLLGGLTGRGDVLFGATVSGRPPEVPGVEQMVGLFINTMPVRVRLDPAESLAGLLTRLQEQQSALMAHQHLGLADIGGLAGLGELFDTLLVFENYPLDPAALTLPGTGLRATGIDGRDATHYPLTVVAIPGPRLEIRLNYRADVLDRADVELLAQRLLSLLELAAADPDRPVGHVDVLTAAERDRLLGEWNGAVLPAGRAESSVQQRFAEQVTATPDAVALIADGERISYRELDRRANRLAHRLIAAGVESEDRVAILLERSVQLVVATLAVLKAGGAYVPLDARSPVARLEQVMAQTESRVLLTEDSFAGSGTETEDLFAGAATATRGIEFRHDAQVILVDTDATLARQPDTDPGVAGHPEQLAYVMYTSGSTGTPKGVAVTHHDVLSLADDSSWHGPNHDRVLLHSPHAFDASTYELWVPLLSGRQLVVAPAGELGIADLARIIVVTEITGLWLTAGLFRLLAEECPECFSGVREVWSGGDVVPPATVRRVLDACPSLVFGDGYGPTETTTFATRHLLRAGDPVPATVPIGGPLDNMRVYVLDDNLRLVPPGVTGELYIAGAGLARGYLRRPAPTAERFVADPFASAGRMYRTGDVVRWNAMGALEFVGRADEQVKIRGFRIELGEIEAALAGRPGLAQLAVIVREDRPGDKRLVGYAVPEAGGDLDLDALRDHAAAALPEYMVPAAFVVLESLPLTVNGKLDRRALPAPDYAAAGTGRAPRTPQEEILCGLFADVLGLPEVGIDDGFFALGGHSLLATRLVSRIRSALGVELAVRSLFEAPTVAKLATSLGNAATARQTLRPMARPERVPMSYGQRRLWFLNRLEGANSPYKIPVALRLRGELDRAALQAALRDVIDRHESLRTVFPESDGEPYQLVLTADAATPTVPLTDLAEDELAEAAQAVVARGFDLSVDPPLRAELFRLGGGEHLLLLVLHHIAGDGWSMAPLARDFSDAYGARLRGEAPGWEPLPVQYADYSLWQREIMGREEDADSAIARQVDFWTTALADLPDQLDLPADRPRPAVASLRGGTLIFEVPAELHLGLGELVRQHQTSLFMVLQAAVAALLTRLGAGTDIPIGSPIAGRTDDALDELVGFFVNTLVLRTDTSGDPTFAELLRRVRDADLAAYANQELPFERLVEVLNPARSMARNPLFQVLLVLQNNSGADLALPGLDVTVENLGAHAAQFDLSMDLTERPDGITGRLDFSLDLFDEDTARAVADRFVRLLGGIVADQDRRIGELDILDPAERQRLLIDWNCTGRADDLDGVVQQVRSIARRRPDAVAVVDDRATLTYGEVAGRASALSRALAADGVGTGSIVGILADRSVRVPVAVLGVLGAGGAYVPLDPRAPMSRVAGLLADSGARWLLTEPARADQARELVAETGEPIEVVVLGEDTDPAADLYPVAGRPADLAYVIFTSGSTGRPKGAMVHRAGMVNHLLAKVEDLALSEVDSVVQNAPLTFDISVWQMLAGLVAGGRVRVIGEDTALDPLGLFERVATERISVLEVVPSLLRTALDAWDAGAPSVALPALRWLMVTGEALPEQVCRRWFDRYPDIPLVNAYGPTECSDDVTHAVLTPATLAAGATVPIGRAIRNTSLYVLDELLEPVPAGVAGELCVGGVGVGHGYLGDAVKTASAFVPDPFAERPGARLYRTGDRVRYRADGQLEFLGRRDHQVKIRGQRIELGEVEAALRAVPGVTDTVVTVSPDPAGQHRLVGYLVGAVDAQRVRGELAAVLPEAMVPSALVALDALPLTSNGKVDRKALPEPDFGAGSGGRPPRTPQEEILCGVFAEVLGVASVGIDDNFFDLGGHSLLATRLVNRVRSVFGAELPIRSLFEHPTVAGLSGRLGAAGGDVRAPLRPMPRPAEVPLSFVQRRLWFLNRFEGAGGAYNVPLALRLSGELDVDALRAALGDLVERHESLRTIFPETDGEPRQVVLDADIARPKLSTVDIAEAALTGEVAAASTEGFDLTRQLPLRVTLFALAETEHVLVLVLHHIASDGASAGPLARDLAAAYSARRTGRAPDWTPLPVQYADYSLWQREVLGAESDRDSRVTAQLDFWRTALAGLPDQLDLPADRPRPAEAAFVGDTVPLTVEPELHQRLVDLAMASQTSLFMIVQAALSALLTRLGAGTDIPLGSPIAGRTDEALDDLVGFFVNTLVLRTDTGGNPSFRALLDRVRETDLAAYAHQDLPFERLVEALNPPRSLARHPLFQVALAFQNHTEIALELPGLRIDAVPAGTGAAKFDLSVSLGEQRDEAGAPTGILGRLEYRTDLFDRDTVATIGTRLLRLLTAVAADPDQPIGAVDLLDAPERERMLVAWNDTDTAVPTATLPELFQAQVARTPDATALLHDGVELSYAELNRRANRLARFLVGRGVGPEQFVAVALPRSADLVVSLLGVLKAGAAYVPVDPDYPADRIEYMLADTRPALLLTNRALAAVLPETAVAQGVLVDDPATLDAVAGHRDGDLVDEDRLGALALGNPAYVIYTSGSTGRPKGVVIEHRSLTDYLAFAGGDYAGVRGLALLHSPISFDLTVTAMFVPLTVGGTVLATTLENADPAVRAELRRRPCTFLKATPSHLPMLAALPEEFSPDTELLLGGELLLGELVDEWRREHPGTTVLNMYGPTETTVNCTEYRIEPGQAIPSGPLPIGRPLANTRLYVLDEHLQPVPVGAPGELYVAGNGLARGYLNRPDLTATKFLPDPFGASGTRMYRTGDVVRWQPDGNLYFLRRVDDQVKLRGFRIELGEIESVLVGRPEIARATVIVREDRPGDQRLVAYLVPETGRDLPEAGSLREQLSARLPEYMLPSAFVPLDDIPLTPNGKVDRRGLPAPDLGAHVSGRSARTQRERVLCELFAEVLGLASVGIDDGFFDLGGHSLLATRLISRVRATFGVDLAIRSLFEAPTVAALAERLGADDGGSAFDTLLPLRRQGTRPPLFCVHPASGLGWSYSGLMKHLGPDVPIYGLQSRGIETEEELPATVEEVAADYLAEIRAVQPSGPYHLLGWSFGGLVAHAMAARLEREGETVALLALLDSFPKVGDERTPRAFLDEQELLHAMLDLAGYDRDSLGDGPVDHARIVELLRDQGGVLDGLEERHLSALYEVFANNSDLARTFVPATVATDVLLFVAALDQGADGPSPDRWRPHVGGAVHRHDVACHHNDMTQPAPLAEIGRVLAETLREKGNQS
ncbi:amino acid adenylation domain-containing protein [Solihabitans fulvus]|uniref:Amino acid adenylation domain-containing protein n=1 Tax=Solihabitans fulvus TaxID=1892852 RepID=A0A5B2WR13_9PSEU|nr:non-ribosomal peptide synthetase [Solihabitans fulvus]KAA2254443.1 amino acid adenylation domain-containing protein [Solihabitans fulvus]